MAFNRKAQYGERIPTVKDWEAVTVQLVEVTDRTGGHPQMRVDVRIFADNGSDGYTGPTKIGFMFDDPNALRDLADALATAADDAEQKGMGTAPAAPKADADIVPVIQVNPRGVAARRAIARNTAAASITRTRKPTTK